MTDSATGLSTKYIYDFTGRTAAVERRSGDSIILRTEQSYNSDDQPIRRTTKFANGANYTYSYTYNADMTPQGMVSGVVGTGFVYDALMRISRVNSEIGVLTRTYGYRTDPHTSQVATLNYENLKGGYSFNYEYDVMGNIASYHLDCVNNNYDEAEFTYTYDSQNQLTKATDGTVTFAYSYDNAGKILTANGHTYTYGNSDWGDLLTAYDGQSITYDEIGNPTSYYNGTRWNFTWEHGRQLATASGEGNNVTYTYDADGLRTSKTVNGVVYTYYYVGSQLARMTYGDYVLDFFYDINGTPIAMRQGYASSNNYTVYYYITNLQGDVIRLVDVNGSTAAYYEYDPYGNAIQAAGSHCNINPLRYRGYVYDTETGLYYLQSRYYDPKIGRFINADALTSTGQGLLGNNMFAYCNDNPINCIDPSGKSPFGRLELWDYYLMHKYVQYLCMAEYGWDMEVYVRGPLGRGSLDLYDYESNSYYEVKTKNTVNRAKPLVDAQMAKYDSSQIEAKRYKEANITNSPTRGTEFISGTFCYGIYDVNYSTKENGLIIYDPVVNKSRSLQTAVVLVMVVCVALGRYETAAAIGAYAAGTA